MFPELSLETVLAQAKEVATALASLSAEISADAWDAVWREMPAPLRLILALSLAVATFRRFRRKRRMLTRLMR